MSSKTKYGTIAQSASVSSAFAVGNDLLVGLWMPAMTGSLGYVQVAFDDTSANFVRAQNPSGSGDLVVSIGSRALSLEPIIGPFPFFRLETANPQANVASLALVTKW